MRRLFSGIVLLLVMGLFVTGCAAIPLASTEESPIGGETNAVTTALNVFAAASLTEAFSQIGSDFAAANPGVEVVFNFAGSNQLATQIDSGAPADVFASANTVQMDNVIGAGHVMGGTQQIFARNRLVVITPDDNPAGLTTLADLAQPRIAIIFAATEVPVGQNTMDFLDKAEAEGALGAGYRDAVIANVVSYEQNVRAVLTKISLGEADAGVVYSSDVGAAAEQVTQIEIPDALNTIAAYPIAALSHSANGATAQQFVDYVLSAPGQQVLRDYGFISIIESINAATP